MKAFRHFAPKVRLFLGFYVNRYLVLYAGTEVVNTLVIGF